MKLTGNKETPFTIEDFEKGLMLAGFISPSSISDIQERLELENYEQQLDKEKSKSTVYFKKVVLAAEIAYQLHKEPTFGHIKFVKILYLCEQVHNMNLGTSYGKYAAGPLDPKFIYSIDAEFKKQRWFNVKKSEYGFKYEPLDNISSYKLYYARYFENKKEDVDRLINLLRQSKSDFCEIIATLFYVWTELIEGKNLFCNDSLVKEFYKWSPAKKRFTEKQLLNAIEWMKTNNIVPTIL